jgi:hypothetical protein
LKDESFQYPVKISRMAARSKMKSPTAMDATERLFLTFFENASHKILHTHTRARARTSHDNYFERQIHMQDVLLPCNRLYLPHLFISVHYNEHCWYRYVCKQSWVMHSAGTVTNVSVQVMPASCCKLCT